MRVTFRGTRGSIAVPGPDTVKYGGNTTCVEVRGDRGDVLIFDAGTGIRSLGMELAADGPSTCHLFISHTHWDHIQGAPFFAPMFIPGYKLFIYGPPDPVNMTGIESVLAKQLEYPHFPVRVSELAADISYKTLTDGQTVDLGFATVTTRLTNHPAMNLGFKVTCDGRTVFFTGDHEPYFNIYEPSDSAYDEYQTIVDERNKAMEEFVKGVDVLIVDAQYTEEEYLTKQGWGHSTFDRALEMARRAGAVKTYLTHHEITRSDADLDRLYAGLLALRGESGLDFELAREGAVVEVSSAGG